MHILSWFSLCRFKFDDNWNWNQKKKAKRSTKIALKWERNLICNAEAASFPHEFEGLLEIVLRVLDSSAHSLHTCTTSWHICATHVRHSNLEILSFLSGSLELVLQRRQQSDSVRWWRRSLWAGKCTGPSPCSDLRDQENGSLKTMCRGKKNASKSKPNLL